MRLVCLFASYVSPESNSDSTHFLDSLSTFQLIKDYYAISKTLRRRRHWADSSLLRQRFPLLTLKHLLWNILVVEQNRCYFLDSFFRLIRADVVLTPLRLLILIYWFTFYHLFTLIFAFQHLARRPLPKAH